MKKLTPWFDAKVHSPVREGWYDCKECSARHYFKDGRWYRDKKSLRGGGYMTIYKMHWRGLQEQRPVSWKSFLESGLRASDDFMPRSAEEQAWLDMAPVGKEFGSREKSERVVAFSKLIAQVEAIVTESGNPAGFDADKWLAGWIKKPMGALGGKAPEEFLETAEGQETISRLLVQIQNSVYS